LPCSQIGAAAMSQQHLATLWVGVCVLLLCE